MPSGLYKASDNEEVMTLFRHYVANYHPHLASIDNEIAIVFREKAPKKGSRLSLGKASKAGPYVMLLGNIEYKFVLEISHDTWLRLDNAQKGALMDHLLCHCKVIEDPETHDLKFGLASPDIQFFSEEMERHGDWHPIFEEEEGEEDGATPKTKFQLNVEGILGKRKTPVARKTPGDSGDPELN